MESHVLAEAGNPMSLSKAGSLRVNNVGLGTSALSQQALIWLWSSPRITDGVGVV